MLPLHHGVIGIADFRLSICDSYIATCNFTGPLRRGIAATPSMAMQRGCGKLAGGASAARDVPSLLHMRSVSHAVLWIALGLALSREAGAKKEKSKRLRAETVRFRRARPNRPDRGRLPARNVMPVSEVIAKLRAGVGSKNVLAEVQQRRIPAKIVDATALELAANGADHQLLAAMKDGRNILTEAQETAYMRLVADGQSAASKPARSPVQRR